MICGFARLSLKGQIPPLRDWIGKRRDENSTKSATEKTHVELETRRDRCRNSKTATGTARGDFVQFVSTTTVTVSLRQIKMDWRGVGRRGRRGAGARTTTAYALVRASPRHTNSACIHTASLASGIERLVTRVLASPLSVEYARSKVGSCRLPARRLS